MGITFLQFEIAPVTGAQARPVFAWLNAHPNPGPKPGDTQPGHNFNKYVISRDGQLVAAFNKPEYMGTDPTSAQWQNSPIVQAIEAELSP